MTNTKYTLTVRRHNEIIATVPTSPVHGMAIDDDLGVKLRAQALGMAVLHLSNYDGVVHLHHGNDLIGTWSYSGRQRDITEWVASKARGGMTLFEDAN